ncbi:helix-turn-helix domain-containing protein [Mucilaginibacter sp. NFX135]|uniref:helix-turn-helix domain-containing protein n=1 Tax=Mucilaginibacter sp. NFX135 TaxID=3402687 RepID=UPI003AFA0607
MNIGIAIKQLRKQKKLSQAELAEQSGLTQTALSQIENGSRRPNVESMKKLTDYFNIPEIVIYLLATESNDVPDEKKEMFEKVFPNLRNMIIGLLEPDDLQAQ